MNEDALNVAEIWFVCNQLNFSNLFGTEKPTRTATSLRPLAPEASVSTNSTIPARILYKTLCSRQIYLGYVFLSIYLT